MTQKQSPLVDLLNLLVDGVGAENFAGNFAAEEDLLLMLTDAGNVARPHLQLVSSKLYSSLRAGYKS